jgi:ABC-2 type transport system ATP-binding protein
MIKTEKLTREFGRLFRKKTAVDQVDLEVEAGEVFGFLGHNGAGKTTTVRMLTGQLRPTSGAGQVAGYDIVRERHKIHPLIGVVFEYQNLYARLSGRENLTIFADLFGITHQRVDELLELVDLKSRGKDKVKKYSNGMKQRLLIARALINQPSVLFLDEPSRGLDPVSAKEIRETIDRLADTGTTVFLTTHYMQEADDLCDRVAFISHGKIISQDTPQNLKLEHGVRRLAVEIRSKNGEKPTSHVLDLDHPADAARLNEWMTTGQVLTMHSQEATLEEVFIELAGRPED